MPKRTHFGPRPLFFVLAASTLLLPFGACDASRTKPVLPSDTPTGEVTDAADKNDITPNAPTPTPGTETDTPVKEEEKKAAPEFSADGGFYDMAFLLELSTDDGNTIYYTLDGSDPRFSSSATEYTKGIFLYNNTEEPNVYSAITDISLGGYTPPQFNVDKGFTVRAVVKTPEGEFGEITTNSYFIGKEAAYYSSMKVISMVTDSDYLFHEDIGAYMIGSKYYEWKKSDEFVQYDAGDVLNVTNYNTSGRETEFPVSVQVFDNGKAVYSTDVGARISGNWSRAHAQKSFRLYARKEYGDGKMRYAFFDELTDANGKVIEAFDKVTLRNGGNDYQELHFRDALIHDLASDLACDMMAAEPCILFVNGEFWGFYMIREKTDGDYIEARYGIPKEDVAVIKNGGIEEGTDEDWTEFRDLCQWAASADMTDEENYKKFCDSFDIQSFMDYMTVETYINNSDWANGGSNNWEAWHSKTVNPELPKADGKWRFILYDTEFSTGLYGSESTQYKYDLLNKMSVGDGEFNYPDILRNACKNDEFRQLFYDNYLRIAETCFAPDVVSEKVDSYVTAYGEATKATFFRFGLDWAAWNYEGEVDQFKEYFSRRPKYAKRYLDTFCGVETVTEPVTPGGNMVASVENWDYYGPADIYTDPGDNSFHVDNPQACWNIWDIQSQACDITLEEGCTYRLTFEASCTVSSSFDIGFNRYDGFGYPTCFWTGSTLTPELTSYEYEFTVDSETFSDWRLCFNYGHGKGNFVVKNVVLTKIAE
ncbi:MAG: hypothetical protein E7268_07770 [Lachnospiraceae bacterium]|nr:hypothetical protein [Lachnospiraceae bacterium]